MDTNNSINQSLVPLSLAPCISPFGRQHGLEVMARRTPLLFAIEHVHHRAAHVLDVTQRVGRLHGDTTGRHHQTLQPVRPRVVLCGGGQVRSGRDLCSRQARTEREMACE